MPAERDDTRPRRLTGPGGQRAPKRGPIEWVRVYPDTHQNAGKPISCVENLAVMLAHYGVIAKFCLMQHRSSVEIAGQVVAAERRNNAAKAQIREWARMNQYPTGSAFDDQLELIIARNWSHPVADWIRSRPWDGVDRFEALLASLTIHPAFISRMPLTRRMLRAWLVTAAKAAMLPAASREGVAAQGVLVLQGAQGCGKSRWVESLVPPDKRAWVKLGCILDPSNRDSLQAATKSWIVEIGELDGTFRRADIAALKAFLTSPTDTYRKAYDAADEDIARRTVYAATVNDPVFLADATGSRRFFVVRVMSCNPSHGIDLQQLWAQAAHIAEAEDDSGWLGADDTRELAESNAAFEALDPLLDALHLAWVPGDGWATLAQVRDGIDMHRQWSVADSRHLARLVKGMVGDKSRTLKGYAQFGLVRREF